MRILTYAGARLLTGDDIAAAVLDFCAALAEDVTAETVDIPVMSADGRRGRATLLVGPASQIVVEDVDTPYDELVDTELVESLTMRTRAHRPAGSSSSGHPDSHGDHPFETHDL